MYLRSFWIALLAVCASLSAQGNNVSLLGQLGGYGFYNDIWGYAHPDGREYALVGTRNGTTIVNATNPAALSEVAFIPGPSSVWRDIRTLGSYAYIVTEGGGGMQIVDMSNPDTPTLVTTWGANIWGNAHNICIDTATGWIYLVGTNVGTVVVDASSNPTNPTLVGTVPSPYIHDMAVENGLGHACALRDGEYEIWDVTSFPFTVLSQSFTPGTFTHNAWPNAQQTYAVTTDEIRGGVTQVFDISNPNAPVARGSYTANPASIPHNAFLIDNICHISHYTEGYRAVDISNPDNPVEVGSYDTWPGPSGGSDGAWGCYPFQPSGNIYVSDTASGLFVLRLDNVNIQHTPLPDTLDELGPYTVTATVTSNDPVTSVRLDWSVGGGATNSVAMTPTGAPFEYSASIPGQLAPSEVSYSITANAGQGSAVSPQNGSYSFYVAALTRVFFDDFESGQGGWTHGFNARQDDWQFGVPNGRSGTGWSDPSAAYSGGNVWGNDLGPSGWNGAYQPTVSNWLQSPTIATGGAQSLLLRFRRWLTVEEFGSDQARVWVNGQVVWQNPSGQDLLDTSWELVQVDISSITNSATSMDIRFTLDTNGTTNFGGWTIDDVEVVGLSDCLPAVLYGPATPGTGGIDPVIATSGTPRVGSANFAVDGSGLLGGAQSFLVVGFAPASVNALGINLLVQPIAATLPATASGAVGVAGAGSASVGLPVPADPTLDNLDLYLQWFAVDPGSASALLSASRGARIRVCSN